MSEIKIKRPRKNKKGFNLIDLFIVIMILAIIGAAAYAYLPGVLASQSGQNSNIEYTVVLYGQSEKVKSMINAGDNVLCDQLTFGSVKSCTASESASNDGEETTYDITVVISSLADVNDSEVLISGMRISAGLEYDLMFSSFKAKVKCTKVDLGGAK